MSPRRRTLDRWSARPLPGLGGSASICQGGEGNLPRPAGKNWLALPEYSEWAEGIVHSNWCESSRPFAGRFLDSRSERRRENSRGVLLERAFESTARN